RAARRGWRHCDDRVPPVLEHNRITPYGFVSHEIVARDDAATPTHLGRDQVSRLPPIKTIPAVTRDSAECLGEIVLCESIPHVWRSAIGQKGGGSIRTA